MNKINKYLLTGIVSLSMTACANLDLNPLSEGSSENWYHDETEIEIVNTIQEAENDVENKVLFQNEGEEKKSVFSRIFRKK